MPNGSGSAGNTVTYWWQKNCCKNGELGSAHRCRRKIGWVVVFSPGWGIFEQGVQGKILRLVIFLGI